jgi:hypothetical protein
LDLKGPESYHTLLYRALTALTLTSALDFRGFAAQFGAARARVTRKGV